MLFLLLLHFLLFPKNLLIVLKETIPPAGKYITWLIVSMQSRTRFSPLCLPYGTYVHHGLMTAADGEAIKAAAAAGRHRPLLPRYHSSSIGIDPFPISLNIQAHQYGRPPSQFETIPNSDRSLRFSFLLDLSCRCRRLVRRGGGRGIRPGWG